MNDLLSHSRLLSGFAAAERRVILDAATPRRFRTKRVITYQGEPATELFLITRGRARHFFTTPNGKKVLLIWLAPGDSFGGAAMLAERPAYHVSTEILQDTSALSWSRQSIRSLAARYPRLLDNGLLIASDYLHWYIAAHLALSCQSAPQRLAGVLMSLAPTLGRPIPEGVELDITNDELANAAHITPFTTSRLLNLWQRQRLVLKRRGKVVLLAHQRLLASSF